MLNMYVTVHVCTENHQQCSVAICITVVGTTSMIYTIHFTIAYAWVLHIYEFRSTD